MKYMYTKVTLLNNLDTKYFETVHLKLIVHYNTEGGETFKKNRIRKKIKN